jgi:methyl-accepting chemotaxis protein
MKIGIRAASVFALLGVLVLSMGLIALYETRQMDKATDEIRITWIPAVVALSEIGSNLGRARAVTLRAALDDDASERARSIEMLKGIKAQLEEGLKAYEDTIIAADDRALFDAFNTARQQYFSLQAQVLQDLAAGRSMPTA